MSVGEGNMLLANSTPIEYREGETLASLLPPDGIQAPLWLSEDGAVEEEPPPLAPSALSLPPLPEEEEEGKRQEALRHSWKKPPEATIIASSLAVSLFRTVGFLVVVFAKGNRKVLG